VIYELCIRSCDARGISSPGTLRSAKEGLVPGVVSLSVPLESCRSSDLTVLMTHDKTEISELEDPKKKKKSLVLMCKQTEILLSSLSQSHPLIIILVMLFLVSS